MKRALANGRVHEMKRYEERLTSFCRIQVIRFQTGRVMVLSSRVCMGRITIQNRYPRVTYSEQNCELIVGRQFPVHNDAFLPLATGKENLVRSAATVIVLFLLSGISVPQTNSQPATAGAEPAPLSSPTPAGQQTSGQAGGSPGSAAPTAANHVSTRGFVLEDGTPVKMRINRTVSSGDAHVGDTVDFEVLEDVSLNGTLVIPKGGLAFATVTEAQAKRRMARGGKLDINIDYVKLADSEKAALRAVKDLKGGGHTGAMVGGMVATSLVFFPAAPFFLFMHGKDITIPKGTEITAYVNGDMKLDFAKFQPASTPAAVAAVAPASGKLQLESDPSGADIEIDGSFVGNTPSDIEVPEGEHTVDVKKAGFRDWGRKLKISGGSNVHLNAALEKAENQPNPNSGPK